MVLQHHARNIRVRGACLQMEILFTSYLQCSCQNTSLFTKTKLMMSCLTIDETSLGSAVKAAEQIPNLTLALAFISSRLHYESEWKFGDMLCGSFFRPCSWADGWTTTVSSAARPPGRQARERNGAPRDDFPCCWAQPSERPTWVSNSRPDSAASSLATRISSQNDLPANVA